MPRVTALAGTLAHLVAPKRLRRKKLGGKDHSKPCLALSGVILALRLASRRRAETEAALKQHSGAGAKSGNLRSLTLLLCLVWVTYAAQG